MLIKQTKLIFQILELGILAIQVVKAFRNTEVGVSTSSGVCERTESRLSSRKVIQRPRVHIRMSLPCKKGLKKVLAIKVGERLNLWRLSESFVFEGGGLPSTVILHLNMTQCLLLRMIQSLSWLT